MQQGEQHARDHDRQTPYQILPQRMNKRQREDAEHLIPRHGVPGDTETTLQGKAFAECPRVEPGIRPDLENADPA